MLKNISPARLAGWWATAVIVMMSCGVVAGGAITIGNAELWLIACVVPPAVMLLLWHGESAVATAAALYSVTNQKEGRR
jgi:hypothetical protein